MRDKILTIFWPLLRHPLTRPFVGALLIVASLGVILGTVILLWKCFGPYGFLVVVLGIAILVGGETVGRELAEAADAAQMRERRRKRF